MEASTKNLINDFFTAQQHDRNANGAILAVLAVGRAGGQLLRNASALSEARFYQSVKSGEVLFARSIEPFEGGRWRLRGRGLKAMGIQSFSGCNLLILLWLIKSETNENRSSKDHHTARRREHSTRSVPAPAGTFKRDYRQLTPR